MTGDSSRRKQALSVFLSTLMVLSVLAMGMAGFAGSAAAASQSDVGSDYSDATVENLEVLLVNESTGELNKSYQVNTTSQTINLTDGNKDDVSVETLGNLDNTSKAIQFAFGNATSTYDTVVVGPGEYNTTAAEGNLSISNNNVASVFSESGSDQTTINTSEDTSLLNVTSGGSLSLGEANGGFTFTSNSASNSSVAIESRLNLTANDVEFQGADQGLEINSGENFDLESGSDVAYDGTTAVSISDGSALNISSTTFTATGGTPTAVDASNLGGGDINIDGVTIDDGNDGDGLVVNDAGSALSITDLTVDNVANGVDISTVSDFNVSSSEFRNVTGTAVNVGDSTTNPANIEGVTVYGVDETPNKAIDINDGSLDLTVDDADINATDVGIDVQAGDTVTIQNSQIEYSNNATDVDASSVGTSLDIQDNRFADGTTGLFVDNDLSDNQINVHFNEFVDNTENGTVVGSSFNNGPLNLTFNDYVGNEENALWVGDLGSQEVNANYNWWGDAAGPGGVVDSNSVVDSSGNAVVPKGSSDVTFTPWLSESTDTLDPTSQSLLVIPDASNPYAQSNNADVASADNQLENATVGVVVLDEDTASGEDGISGINLIDSNVDDAEISQGSLQGSDVSKSAGVTQNISANVTGDVEFRAVGDNNAGPDEFTQTFSNDIDSVEVELNRSTLPAGETARATITLYDSNGEVIENTGTPVGFSFSPSDEISVSAEDQITRGGTASAEFTTTTPGQNISVQAFENKNGESATVSLGTATGAVSASESEFNFKGNTVSGNSEDLTGGSAANAGTEHDLSAVIRDSSGNALEDVEVEFNQNTTAEFGDEMPLETDANGVVNTTVTLPEDAGVTTEISIAADDFNPDQTTDANVNVTTQAAAADSLSFANDNIVVPSGQTSEVTVEIVDEFGNHNDGIDSGEIALSSDTSDEISVESSPVSVDAGGNATFTLNATAQSGSVNLTATRSGVDDATTTATIGEPQDIQITVDNSSIASGVDNATDVTDVTAQFVDANGDAIGVGSSEIRFTREDGDAAKVNSSAAIDSDSSGAATFEAIATSQTGDTTFELSSPEFDVSNTTTITTTGAPDTIGFSPNVSSPAVNDTVDVTVTVEDSQNRVVPVTAQNYFDMSVQSDAGSFVESDTVRDASDGEGSINVTSSEGGDVTVDAFISAEALNDDTTITFTDQSANYTLELVDGPTTITQNESYSATLRVTNEGEVAGNQTVSYVLEDDTGAATAIDVERAGVELDAGNSTNLTFNAPADATAGLATGNYTHVFSSEDDELTVDAVVVEEPTDEFDPVEEYGNQMGQVDTTGLLDAIADWRNDDLSVEQLLEVIAQWRMDN